MGSGVPPAGPSTDEVCRRVAAARAVQMARAGSPNAGLPDAELEARVRPTAESRRLLGRAVERFGLSARGARRVLRIARTIADLAGEPRTEARAVAEALGFRGEVDP